MTEVFCDTSYWRAIINRHDPYHALALEAFRALPNQTTFVTTEPVMNELLNSVSGEGVHLKQKTLEYVDRMRAPGAPSLVIHLDNSWFDDALSLWRKRMDKGWSLTDCYSMLVMKARHMRRVLTTDHHFTQGGFTVLMTAKA